MCHVLNLLIDRCERTAFAKRFRYERRNGCRFLASGLKSVHAGREGRGHAVRKFFLSRLLLLAEFLENGREISLCQSRALHRFSSGPAAKRRPQALLSWI